MRNRLNLPWPYSRFLETDTNEVLSLKVEVNNGDFYTLQVVIV